MVSPVMGFARVVPARITVYLLFPWWASTAPASSSSSSSARPSSARSGPRRLVEIPKFRPQGCGVPLAAMEEIGLFPLGIVLLPTERVPLHIFEPRYRELIGECLEEDGEFGLLYADEDGVREVGTRAGVTDVLERFDDGRLNVVVEGRDRFQVAELTRSRSFLTAVVEPVDDEPGSVEAETAARAAGSFRALAALAEAEAEEVDESSPQLSFELAAQVELAPDAKQRLLELRSEEQRLELLAEMLDAVRATLIATRELGERSKRNGSRL